MRRHSRAIKLVGLTRGFSGYPLNITGGDELASGEVKGRKEVKRLFTPWNWPGSLDLNLPNDPLTPGPSWRRELLNGDRQRLHEGPLSPSLKKFASQLEFDDLGAAERPSGAKDVDDEVLHPAIAALAKKIDRRRARAEKEEEQRYNPDLEVWQPPPDYLGPKRGFALPLPSAPTLPWDSHTRDHFTTHGEANPSSLRKVPGAVAPHRRRRNHPREGPLGTAACLACDPMSYSYPSVDGPATFPGIGSKSRRPVAKEAQRGVQVSSFRNRRRTLRSWVSVQGRQRLGAEAIDMGATMLNVQLRAKRHVAAVRYLNRL